MAGRALVGHTGFVGGLLERAQPFDGHFNSGNVEELPERAWDEVVCAAMPAEKWRANREPAGDAAALERLWRALDATSAGRVLLISTVDVFDPPAGQDESAPPGAGHAYGANRAELERRVLGRFEDVAVVRLPSLYGPGLKKNALYDMLAGRPCPTGPAARFQWYDLERLPGDLAVVAAERLRLVQLVTEPVSMGAIAERCFPDSEIGEGPAPAYDLRTRHAETFGGSGAYLQDAAAALAGIERFVTRVRAGEIECASPSR
ncbi:MAG: hypothetical protein M3P50_09240 [Actinomycetota bacterium]|nr:hypothetical protein [Actinomycetota bacterium]